MIFKKKNNNKPVGGHKTMNEVVAWLETHGIDRSTAAQIMGFLRAFDITLPMINLCNYGLTYSFSEFVDWFYSKPEDTTPQENQVCIFWDNDNSEAVIGVLKETKGKPGYPLTSYVDNEGVAYSNCMRFDTLAQYRTLLNTPNEEEIPLPQMAYVKLVAEEIKKNSAKKPTEPTKKNEKVAKTDK